MKSRISIEQAERIRELYWHTNITRREIAQQYGVSTETINRICRGETHSAGRHAATLNEQQAAIARTPAEVAAEADRQAAEYLARELQREPTFEEQLAKRFHNPYTDPPMSSSGTPPTSGTDVNATEDHNDDQRDQRSTHGTSD